MFDFGINFKKVILENLASKLHAPKRFIFLHVASKPFRVIYSDFIKKWRVLYTQAVNNGQVVYLETVLNDRFDSTLRRITVTDAFFLPLYIYKRVENKPPIRLYRRWNVVSTFAAGQYSVLGSKIYVASAPCTGSDVPGVSPNWTLTGKTLPYLRMKGNFSGTITIYINLPTGLAYDPNELTNTIKFYKLAGLGHMIRFI